MELNLSRDEKMASVRRDGAAKPRPRGSQWGLSAVIQAGLKERVTEDSQGSLHHDEGLLMPQAKQWNKQEVSRGFRVRHDKV